MSEKIIRPDFGKKEEGEKTPDLKVGDWVNLKGNFDPEHRGMEFWAPVKINEEKFQHMADLSHREEKYFKEAFGMRWKILEVNLVKDYIRIQTKYNDGLYGKVLEMFASPSAINKSKNQKD